MGQTNSEPQIAPDRVSSGPTSFTGSVAMNFMSEHAPNDPIEVKCQHLDAGRRWVRVRDARWSGAWTLVDRRHGMVLDLLFAVCLCYSLPSDFLWFCIERLVIFLLLGRLEHARA